MLVMLLYNLAEVRAAAIERYGGCIITGTSITDLVQAAHIKPWSTGECDVDDDDNIILLRYSPLFFNQFLINDDEGVIST